MAAHTAHVAQHATLGVSTVDSVLFTGSGTQIEVHNLSAVNPIYVTTGLTVAGTADPTVAGDDTFVVPPTGKTTLPYPVQASGLSTACVKLISVGAQVFSVQVLSPRQF